VANLVGKSFDAPDETRTPEKTTVDVVDLGDGVKAARFTMEPGWRWSECVKPVVGTDRCQVRHVGAVLSGRIHVVHDDGTETEAGPNDAYRIEPWPMSSKAQASQHTARHRADPRNRLTPGSASRRREGDHPSCGCLHRPWSGSNVRAHLWCPMPGAGA
jgi:hypothetical protein